MDEGNTTKVLYSSSGYCGSSFLQEHEDEAGSREAEKVC